MQGEGAKKVSVKRSGGEKGDREIDVDSGPFGVLKSVSISGVSRGGRRPIAIDTTKNRPGSDGKKRREEDRKDRLPAGINGEMVKRALMEPLPPSRLAPLPFSVLCCPSPFHPVRLLDGNT